jgi:cytochrome b subunit of formate dehydrogenase
MLAHNALDYIVKARAHIQKARAESGEERLARWARVQHFSLVVLFVLLAYTGFVHKFPEATWSWPFQAMPNGNYVRGMIHRIAGWAFVGLLIVHCCLLLGTKVGRTELKALWLRVKDWNDLWATIAFNLGLRKTLPKRERFNYAEKAEYWALMWGSIVMILTGVMLIFTEAVLRFLPKVWLDVAQVVHYYEAVLATLAIIVWHFYAVIFDPREYPMNPAWLIGKKPHVGEKETKEEEAHVAA